MDQSQAATQKSGVALKPNYSLDIYTPSPSNDLAGTQMPARTIVNSHLIYVHMYAAYDIRWPICDSEFCFNLPNILLTFIYIHLSSYFFGPRSKKSLSHIGCHKSESDTCKQPNINEREGKIAIANRPSDVVSRIHVYVHLVLDLNYIEEI